MTESNANLVGPHSAFDLVPCFGRVPQNGRTHRLAIAAENAGNSWSIDARPTATHYGHFAAGELHVAARRASAERLDRRRANFVWPAVCAQAGVACRQQCGQPDAALARADFCGNTSMRRSTRAAAWAIDSAANAMSGLTSS